MQVEVKGSRNEGFIAVNRLTSGYLAHHTERRKLVAWVKAKARPGTWVDILCVIEGGGEHKVAGFMVGAK
jgi:hypothetical protein